MPYFLKTPSIALLRFTHVVMYTSIASKCGRVLLGETYYIVLIYFFRDENPDHPDCI